MKKSTIYVGLAVAVLALPVALAGRHLRASHAGLEAARGSLATVVADSQRIQELRQKDEKVAERRRPDQDVIARVNAVLEHAGVNPGAFGGLTPEADAALAGAAEKYRQQSVRIALRGLTVAELGRFLANWQATQDLWVPSRVDLTHARQGQNTGRYDATVVLTAIYLAE